ncbi:uncharacterized protein LOC135359617 [Latimeria chalumnae]|uniref:uncharacterized protein LOC135359617 n=1 Tax=Latimeria chalumnae TaxID=7897 RepID=UPI00313E5C7B
MDQQGQQVPASNCHIVPAIHQGRSSAGIMFKHKDRGHYNVNGPRSSTVSAIVVEAARQHLRAIKCINFQIFAFTHYSNIQPMEKLGATVTLERLESTRTAQIMKEPNSEVKGIQNMNLNETKMELVPEEWSLLQETSMSPDRHAFGKTKLGVSSERALQQLSNLAFQKQVRVKVHQNMILSPSSQTMKENQSISLHLEKTSGLLKVRKSYPIPQETPISTPRTSRLSASKIGFYPDTVSFPESGMNGNEIKGKDDNKVPLPIPLDTKESKVDTSVNQTEDSETQVESSKIPSEVAELGECSRVVENELDETNASEMLALCSALDEDRYFLSNTFPMALEECRDPAVIESNPLPVTQMPSTPPLCPVLPGDPVEVQCDHNSQSNSVFERPAPLNFAKVTTSDLGIVPELFTLKSAKKAWKQNDSNVETVGVKCGSPKPF